MSDPLLYQTSDTDFADRVIESLRDAGISCYRIGRGNHNLNATIGRWTDDQVSIYLQQESDAGRANEILVKLGAVIDEPLRSPSHWVLFLIGAIFAVIVFVSMKL